MIAYEIHAHSHNGEWKSLRTFHDFTKNCLEDKHLPKGWTWEGSEKINHLEIIQASDRFVLYIHAPMVSPTPTRKYLLLLPLLHRVAAEMLRFGEWRMNGSAWNKRQERTEGHTGCWKPDYWVIRMPADCVQFFTQVRRQRKSPWLTELGQDGGTDDCQLLNGVKKAYPKSAHGAHWKDCKTGEKLSMQMQISSANRRKEIISAI